MLPDLSFISSCSRVSRSSFLLPSVSESVPPSRPSSEPSSGGGASSSGWCSDHWRAAASQSVPPDRPSCRLLP